MKNNQQEIRVNTDHTELKNGYVMHEEVQRRVVVQPIENYQPHARQVKDWREELKFNFFKKPVAVAILVLAAAPGAVVGLLTQHEAVGLFISMVGLTLVLQRLHEWVWETA